LIPFEVLTVFRSEIIVILILVLFVFIINLALFNIVLSRVFSNPESCTKWIVILHLGLVVVIQVVRAIFSALAVQDKSYGDVGDALDYIGYILIPGYGLNQNFNLLARLSKPATISDAFSFKDGVIKRGLLLSIACFGIYIILCTILEVLDVRIKKSGNAVSNVSYCEDCDVSAERARIETPDLNQTMKENTVVVRGVEKVYSSGLFKKKKVNAVNNVSFGIHENDCFGLLGPNGAGKSTLINMMTAELDSTNGTIAVNGEIIHGWRHKLFPIMKLGRCMQNDALMDFLSPEQHIAIMSAIRCDSTKRSINEDVQNALEDLELNSYANRPVRALSGGMCRKLSAALAMLPGTRWLVFDEPSTGMDPVTRRSLWSAITKQRKSSGRSVLLTTHSMEEAETLCGTMGIVNRGRLQCFGNIQHLKTRFSNGYRVMIEYADEALIPACEAMLRKFLKEDLEQKGETTSTTTPIEPLSDEQLMALVDTNGMRRTYGITCPRHLSALFTQIEGNSQSFQIVSYAIYQATLEDVFVTIVKDSELQSSVPMA